MKAHLITLAVAILCVSNSPPAQAQGSISVDFFYDNLQSHGHWRDVGDYGYVWQPRDIQSDWSPYSDGRWVYTDAGWTWDSYEPFGWAVYHYGRWANVRQVGWVWVPGTQWGPAWVSWRHSSNYVGWAPLPPEARFSVGIGFSSWVDDYYNIGPSHYRFVEGRHLGSRHINRSFIDNSRNLTLINETTNITNITYQDNVIYNGGPDFEEQMRLSSDPIPRYTLDRRQEFDADLIEQTPEQLQSRAEGDSFVVAAPTLDEADSTSAPENISEKVETAEIDRGWADEASAEEAAAKRKERLAEAELPAGLPPEPTFEGTVDSPRAEAAAAAQSRAKAKGADRPGADSSAPRPTAPDAPGSGKAKADQPGRPGTPTAAPTAAPTTPTPSEPGSRPGKGKTASPDSPPASTPSVTPPGEKGRPGRPDAGAPSSAPSSPDPQTRPSRPTAPEGRPGRPPAGAPDSAPQVQPPQSAPQEPAGRPTQREPKPERPPRAGGTGKGIPSPVPPSVKPVEEPETAKGKGRS